MPVEIAVQARGAAACTSGTDYYAAVGSTVTL